MNRLYIPLAFICGMLFLHSLNGEYARYGMNIADEIDMCELDNEECTYIVAPVSNVSINDIEKDNLPIG